MGAAPASPRGSAGARVDRKDVAPSSIDAGNARAGSALHRPAACGAGAIMVTGGVPGGPGRPAPISPVPHVTARGLSFHVLELAAERRGPAPPVALLHGLLVGNLASWYFTAAPALAEQRRLWLYDLRGHGRSDRPPRGYDLASMAADLEALADQGFRDASAGPPPAPSRLSLVGHSYGGLVALRFALDHPGRVERLAMIEPPLPPSRFAELVAFAHLPPEERLAALPETLRSLVPAGGKRARKLTATLDALVNETSLLADVGAEPDIPDAELGRLDCPLLCVVGDRSGCRAIGERLARAIPRSELTVLEGGHDLHLEATSALSRTLREFLG